MITRGIVETRVDSYHVKVRIPTIDRIQTSSIHTETADLSNAILATIPGLEIDLSPGDVVIVSIDDIDETFTIIGYLYRDASIKKQCSLNLNSLNVSESAVLPKNTRIGNVTSESISFLDGLRDNIQYQIDELRIQLDNLRSK